ncbi:hypothetical protein NDU88_009540 [Pleurodeles waltl]|uniref:Uncharacterized protein n=1 Tax=Pleurodeles waltl TaxID=8319 RepID=A0AAV7PV79_PLEWA|nr:hypothetical protein NDU88_009540 [Pleurodeles waltl]
MPDLWGFGEAIRRQTLSALSQRCARLVLLQAPAFFLVALTTVVFDALRGSELKFFALRKFRARWLHLPSSGDPTLDLDCVVRLDQVVFSDFY